MVIKFRAVISPEYKTIIIKLIIIANIYQDFTTKPFLNGLEDIKSSQKPIGTMIIIPILQIRNVRLREIDGHRVS